MLLCNAVMFSPNPHTIKAMIIPQKYVYNSLKLRNDIILKMQINDIEFTKTEILI
jgi:hypothetical protein